MRVLKSVKLGENRLGSAIRMDEIPEPYRSYKLLGRGTTTMVFEDPADKDKVLMLTKGGIKREWLASQWGLQLGETIDMLAPEKKHPIKSLDGMDIYVISVPRLFKLSTAEFNKIHEVIEKYTTSVRGNPTRVHAAAVSLAAEKATDPFEKSILTKLDKLYFFLANYGEEDFMMDLHKANIMKTASGEYILVDPVIETDIHNAILGQKMKVAYDKRGYKY